ncbi:MAG: alpha/beta hydrolase [Lachnospiraceae bacterium]|nr:alpha/beta hydrolase [Lachnospiraceae bacterium]
MSTRRDLKVASNDGVTSLKVVVWQPEGDIRAILQLSHGMVEHIERYTEFGEFLADKGILVVGNDHLGHGESIVSKDKLGYFCDNNPSEVLVDDLHKIGEEIRKEYPGIPYFIFGHSMGSFIVRNYIAKYGEGLKGAVICGTGDLPNSKIKPGLALIKTIKCFKGKMYLSKFVDSLVIGDNDKYFKDSEYKSWLSKDEEKVKKYYADPLCGYMFTLNGYQTLVELIIKNNDAARRARVPKDLPLLIVSGDECCLGEFGKGVKRVYEKYKAAGIKDVTCRLYQHDRHEILNETDRDVVFADIYDWINSKL